MSKLKKLLTTVLCMILFLSVLSACGGDSDNNTLTIFYSDLAGINTAIRQKTDVYKKYMEDCGVEFKALTTGGGDSEAQLQKMFNVGELPDVFIHRTAELPKFYYKLIKDGAILAVSDYVSETTYPNIYKQISKHDYLTSNIDFTNGKHYAIPTEFMQEHTLFVRQDWIDALNKPEKLDDILVDEGYVSSKNEITSVLREQYKFTQPQDLIGFYRLARAFTKYDPDGNGNDDTYGYTSTSDMYSDNWLYVAGGGYRIMQDYEGDGTYSFSGTSDENKYIVGFINRLLKEGFMDPSWISDKTAEKTAKFGQSKVGMIESQMTMNTFVGYFRNLLNCTNEEAAEKIAMVTPPKGRPVSYKDENGETKTKQMYGIQGHPNFWTSISFSSSMSEQKRNQAFKMIDYLLTDKGKDLINLGVEGVHYEKAENGELTSLMGKDENGMNKDIFSIDNFSGMRIFNSMTRFYYSPFQSNSKKIIDAMENAKSYNRYADYYMLTTPKFTEYWDGLCDKMITEFAAMERNETLYNAGAHQNQKMSDIDWNSLVIYSDDFTDAWASYVLLLDSSYKGNDIKKEYNEYILDHGVKTVAPELDF